MNLPCLPRLIVLIAVTAAVSAGFAANADAGQIVTIKGHRIVALNSRTGNVRTLKKLKPFQSITSVSTARKDPSVIAYSIENKKRLASYTLIKDQIWLMKRNGSGSRLIKQLIRKQRGHNVFYPKPDQLGSLQGIQRVELSPDGHRILVTKPFPFVAYEFTIGKSNWHLVNPGECGMSNPSYDSTGHRILAFFNCGKHHYGIGIMSLAKKKPRIFLKHDVDFLTSAPTMSPDGNTIAFPAGKTPDGDPDDGSVANQTGIWVMDRNGRHKRILRGTRSKKGEAGVSFEFPQFSGNGKKISMTSTNRSIGTHGTRVYVINADGTRLQTIFREPTRFHEPVPVWLP